MSRSYLSIYQHTRRWGKVFLSCLCNLLRSGSGGFTPLPCLFSVPVMVIVGGVTGMGSLCALLVSLVLLMRLSLAVLTGVLGAVLSLLPHIMSCVIFPLLLFVTYASRRSQWHQWTMDMASACIAQLWVGGHCFFSCISRFSKAVNEHVSSYHLGTTSSRPISHYDFRKATLDLPWLDSTFSFPIIASDLFAKMIDGVPWGPGLVNSPWTTYLYFEQLTRLCVAGYYVLCFAVDEAQ